jgi:hypothetical protein
MAGVVWYAISKDGNAQVFLTPYASMMAMDQQNMDGDMYVGSPDGKQRSKLAHHTPEGGWTHIEPDQHGS